jgi:hypothetical protein
MNTCVVSIATGSTVLINFNSNTIQPRITKLVGMWAHGSQFNFPPQASSIVNQQKVSSFLGHHCRDPGRVVSQEISQLC